MSEDLKFSLFFVAPVLAMIFGALWLLAVVCTEECK